eukprot:GHRR01037515.1.p2 GENE.GHRR01037515.1~~GHRR01037515.1.p2  ORF type:complete len:140 (+),score=24.36 GHRR01037515.1:244-663(+)
MLQSSVWFACCFAVFLHGLQMVCVLEGRVGAVHEVIAIFPHLHHVSNTCNSYLCCLPSAGQIEMPERWSWCYACGDWHVATIGATATPWSACVPVHLQGLQAVYPPEGGVGAVHIVADDLARLDPDEFLNDTIIDYYIK